MNITQNLPRWSRVFLDALGLDYLPEKHCPPPYGKQAEIQPEKTGEKPPKKEEDNGRKVRDGFLVDTEEESKPEIDSAWKLKSKSIELTEDDIRELKAAKLSIKTAEVVKAEKVLNHASNQTITDKYHVTGRRDGFGLTTIDKIAAIVAPSPDRGEVNQKQHPKCPKNTLKSRITRV